MVGVGVVLHYRVRLDHGAMSTGKFAGAVASHLGVVQTLGDVLAGTGKTFIGNGPDPTCDPKRDLGREQLDRQSSGQATQLPQPPRPETGACATPNPA